MHPGSHPFIRFMQKQCVKHTVCQNIKTRDSSLGCFEFDPVWGSYINQYYTNNAINYTCTVRIWIALAIYHLLSIYVYMAKLLYLKQYNDIYINTLAQITSYSISLI